MFVRKKLAKRSALGLIVVIVATDIIAGPVKHPIYRSADDRVVLEIISPDRLELTNDSGKYNCSYMREGETLRVTVAKLGSVTVLHFKPVLEGFVGDDGTVLYGESHLKARPSKARQNAINAPRPEYPAEARMRHITGSGIALLSIDPSGSVTDVTMLKNTGSPILDNSIVSAFKRWRFKPGATDSKVRIPVTYTMTGASY